MPIDHGTTEVTVGVNDFDLTYQPTAAPPGADVNWRVGDSSVCGISYNKRSAEIAFRGLKEGDTMVTLTWVDQKGEKHVQRFHVTVKAK